MFNTIKSIVFISLLTLISVNLQSQNTWSKKLKSNENTFKQVQEDFEEQWNGKEYVKGHGWKQFHRWENFWESRLMPDGSYPDFRQAYNEYNNYMSNKSMVNGNWLPMGPFSHINTDSWSSGSGRVNVIVEDPNDPNTIYVGAPAGGIWKSIDAGSSWTPLGDEISVIGVSGIAVDPNDTDVIYIATGDSDAGDTYSIGLMKSMDAGLTWSLLDDIGQVNKILIDPTTTSTIWASGSNGLYKSTDSGATWVQKQGGNMRDMAINPGNSQIVYGVTSSSFYYTNDGGDTPFNSATGLPGNSSRMVIGVTPANNSMVYVVATTPSGGFDDVYKSVNSGASFTGQNVLNDIFDGSTQSWYDLAIGVSDTDENTLFCGVLNVWKSTDGGSTWGAINSWSNPNGASYTHADIHYLNYYNGNFYCGSDGGIYKSTNDGTNFTDLTAGLQIGQFYKIGGSPNDANVISGGLQDNGGFAWNGSVWRNYYGADGMDNAVDPNNSNNIYGMIQYGGLYYSNNGGLSNIGAPSSGQDGRWVTPTQHDLNNDRLVVGYDDLFEFNTVSNSWNQLSTFNFPSKISDVEIYDGNSNIIFVSTGNNLYKTTNNGNNFNEITGTLPGSISSIEVNPADDDELWVTIGGWTANKVYHTTNGGGTWTSISNGLPNLPTNIIKYDATNDGLYLGMDIGIYFRNDILGSWVPYNTNLPNVIVKDIEINEASNLVRVGTYGRGVWTSGTYDVPVLTENAQLVSINTPVGTYCENNPTPEISVRNIGTNTITDLTINFEYDNGGSFAYTWSGSISSGMIETITLFGMPVTEGDHTYSIDIVSVNGGVDGDPSDNTDVSNFAYLDGSTVTYSLLTDCYANESSWVLREQDSGIIIDQAAPNTLIDETTYDLQYCLADMCYELEIIDSYGDGMSSSSCDPGFYEVTDELSNVLVTMNNANFGFGITNTFCLPIGSAILGCMDTNACNFDSTAQQDDGSCTFPGCIDTTASNYDATAGCSDGSCEYAPDNDNCDNAIDIFCGQTVTGNTDNAADNNTPACGTVNGAPGLWYSIIGTGSDVTFSTCNQAQYDSKIDIFTGPCDNLTCFAENDDGANCSGNSSLLTVSLDLGVEYYIYLNGWNGSTGSFSLTVTCDNVILGCTNITACNYDSNATQDDGSCILPDGCTNMTACNYDSNALCDDGSCILPDGCTNMTACNYDSNAQCDDGSCILPDGCTDMNATNYDSNAQCDDGTCEYEGCMPVGGLSIESIQTSSVNISWETVSGATGYRVKRTPILDPQGNVLGAFNPISVGQLTTNTSYNFNGLSPGYTYELRVKNDCISSTWSAPKTVLIPYAIGLNTALNIENCSTVPVDFTINNIGEQSFVFTAITQNIYLICKNLTNPLMDITIELKDNDQNIINTINDYGNQENEAGLYTGLTIGNQYIISLIDNASTNGQAEICALPLASPSCSLNPGYPSVFNYSIAHHTGSPGAVSYSTSWQNAASPLLIYNYGSQTSPYFSLEDIGIPPGDNNYNVTYTANFDLPLGGQIGEATNTALQSIVQSDPCLVEVSIPTNVFDSYLKNYYSYSDGSCTLSNISDVSFSMNSALAIHTGTAADYWRYEFTDVGNNLPPVEYNSPSGYWVMFNVANTINAVESGYISAGSCYQVRVKPMDSDNNEIAPYGSVRIWKTAGIAGGSIAGLVDVTNNNGPFVNKQTQVSVSEFSIYPNPNNGELLNININSNSDEQILFEIYDLFGRLIQTETLSVNSGIVNEIIQINKQITSGIYNVKITMNGIPQYERLVIER